MPVETQIAGHLAELLNEFDVTVEVAASRLAEVEYDTLVGTGLSGTLIVPVLARKLGKYWAVVRKEIDLKTPYYEGGTHSDWRVEGRVGDRWFFVDDLISSGRTFERVQRAMREEMPHSKYVGYYLYESGNMRVESIPEPTPEPEITYSLKADTAYGFFSYGVVSQSSSFKITEIGNVV